MVGGYPPGAANDSRAPYNQEPANTDRRSFETKMDTGAGDPVDIKVVYEYQQGNGETVVTDYWLEGKWDFLIHEFSDFVEEFIREDLGRRNVTFQ